MKHVKDLFQSVKDRLESLARRNVVVAKKISVGDRHVIPLCSLSFGFGGGGGRGEGSMEKAADGSGQGSGLGAGTGFKISPQAVIVVDGDQVRLESLIE